MDVDAWWDESLDWEEIWRLMNQECPVREDGTHCVHWWDGEAPCCNCGNNESLEGGNFQ